MRERFLRLFLCLSLRLFRGNAMGAFLPGLLLLLLAACGGVLLTKVPPLGQLSTDPYTAAPGQHKTEVEPHMAANGSTLGAGFQTGRIYQNGGGAMNIGWATSTDGGANWTHGFLPGIMAADGGPYDTARDTVVAYDSKHSVWMISSLVTVNATKAETIVVSRSTDGGFTWESPVSVDPTYVNSDKNWIVCDNWPSGR